MPHHLPTPLSLTAHDFDTYSRAHTRISEAIEALAQCRLSFCDFGGDFEAYAAAHAERTTTLYRLHDAQAYAAAWAQHALGQLDAAVSCATKPPTATPSTPTPLTRRIISTNRTVHPNSVAIIDAVADDGTAWWVAQGDDENGWRQLPPLPDREVG